MAAAAAMVGKLRIAAQSSKVWPWAIPSCFGAAQNGCEPTDPLNFLRLLLLPLSRCYQLLKLMATRWYLEATTGSISLQIASYTIK